MNSGAPELCLFNLTIYLEIHLFLSATYGNTLGNTASGPKNYESLLQSSAKTADAYARGFAVITESSMSYFYTMGKILHYVQFYASIFNVSHHAYFL